MRRLAALVAAVVAVGVLLGADYLARAAQTSPATAWARPLVAVAVVAAVAPLILRKDPR